ncbi:MAG: ATP-dependent DNA ligase [Candidatus Pacearchaeota archaeon]|jgi:DNA ligase-1
MRYSELCEVYERIGGTTKRLEKTDILSHFLKKVSDKDKDILYLLLGNIESSYGEGEIGISSQTVIKAISKVSGQSEELVIKEWKKIGDLGEVAGKLILNKKQSTLFSKSLAVDDIVKILKEISKFEGKGTVGKKIDLIAGLLSNSSSIEAKYIVRTLMADLRIGIKESTIRDAIALAFFSENSKEAAIEIQNALDLNPDIVMIFEHAKKGIKSLKSVSLVTNRPIKAMLAPKVSSIEEGFEVVGKPAAFEYKYDGFRLIISRDGDKVSLFTRRLDNVTKQFPEVVSYVKQYIDAKSFIVDSEIVGFDPKTKRYLPFQSISQRIKRKYEIEKMVRDFPVEVNVFDLLMINGKNLLNEPFQERTKTLREIVRRVPYKIICAKQLITNDEKKAKNFFDEALKENQEGVMIKNLNGIYKPGARVGYMVKLKPNQRDLDLVIVGAEYGTGKRAGWMSSFILACYDEESGDYLEVGKVGTGIKEKSEEGVSFDDLTQLLKPFIIETTGKNVKLKPKVVVSITYQEIQKSPTYNSGYALRFPRVTALRDDRRASEINTLDEVKKEYQNQK